MSRTSPPRRHPMHPTVPHPVDRELSSIQPAALAGVVGGRFSPRKTLDPVLTQGMQQLSQAVASIGQNMAASKQQSMQQMMQMVQSRAGGGGGGAPGGGGGGGGAMGGGGKRGH